MEVQDTQAITKTFIHVFTVCIPSQEGDLGLLVHKHYYWAAIDIMAAGVTRQLNSDPLWLKCVFIKETVFLIIRNYLQTSICK